LIFLGLAELDHGELVIELALDASDGGELILKRGSFLHYALCALLVAPEIRILGLVIQFRQADTGLVEVKDASSAAQPTA
jgi:hypothetical protein